MCFGELLIFKLLTIFNISIRSSSTCKKDNDTVPDTSLWILLMFRHLTLISELVSERWEMKWDVRKQWFFSFLSSTLLIFKNTQTGIIVATWSWHSGKKQKCLTRSNWSNFKVTEEQSGCGVTHHITSRCCVAVWVSSCWAISLLPGPHEGTITEKPFRSLGVAHF